MSRFQALCIKVLARFGVDPAAGDLAEEVSSWPEAPPPRPRAALPLESPYECPPTRWGDEAVPASRRPRSPRRPPTLDELLGRAAAPQPVAESSPEDTRVERRRRRMKLEVDPQPPPKGLLTS